MDKAIIKVTLFIVMLCLFFSIYAGPKVYRGEKVILEVMTYQPLGNSIKEMLPAFKKQFPNITVKVKEQGFNEHHTALQTLIAARKGLPDVAFVEIQFVGPMGTGGGFENLFSKPFNAKKYEMEIAPAAWRRAQARKNDLFAIPVDVAPGCGYYNVDLLRMAGMKAEDIKTMDDLFELGKRVTIDTDGDGKIDKYLISDPFNIMRIFLDSDKFNFFDEKGKPQLNRPRMIEAVTWFKKVVDAGLTPRIGEWSPEWYATFQNGTCAFQFSGCWLAGYLKDWIAPKQVGKFVVAELPAPSVGKPRMRALRGGSYAGIPLEAKDKKKGAAWEFIKFYSLNDKVQLDNYKGRDAFPAKISTWNDPMFEEPVPYLYGEQKARRLWRKLMKEAPDQYVHEGDRVAFTLLGTALEDVRTGRKTPQQACDDMQKEIEKRYR